MMCLQEQLHVTRPCTCVCQKLCQPCKASVCCAFAHWISGCTMRAEGHFFDKVLQDSQVMPVSCPEAAGHHVPTSPMIRSSPWACVPSPCNTTQCQADAPCMHPQPCSLVQAASDVQTAESLPDVCEPVHAASGSAGGQFEFRATLCRAQTDQLTQPRVLRSSAQQVRQIASIHDKQCAVRCSHNAELIADRAATASHQSGMRSPESTSLAAMLRDSICSDASSCHKPPAQQHAGAAACAKRQRISTPPASAQYHTQVFQPSAELVCAPPLCGHSTSRWQPKASTEAASVFSRLACAFPLELTAASVDSEDDAECAASGRHDLDGVDVPDYSVSDTAWRAQSQHASSQQGSDTGSEGHAHAASEALFSQEQWVEPAVQAAALSAPIQRSSHQDAPEGPVDGAGATGSQHAALLCTNESAAAADSAESQQTRPASATMSLLAALASAPSTQHSEPAASPARPLDANEGKIACTPSAHASDYQVERERSSGEFESAGSATQSSSSFASAFSRSRAATTATSSRSSSKPASIRTRSPLARRQTVPVLHAPDGALQRSQEVTSSLQRCDTSGQQGAQAVDEISRSSCAAPAAAQGGAAMRCLQLAASCTFAEAPFLLADSHGSPRPPTANNPFASPLRAQQVSEHTRATSVSQTLIATDMLDGGASTFPAQPATPSKGHVLRNSISQRPDSTATDANFDCSAIYALSAARMQQAREDAAARRGGPAVQAASASQAMPACGPDAHAQVWLPPEAQSSRVRAALSITYTGSGIAGVQASAFRSDTGAAAHMLAAAQTLTNAAEHAVEGEEQGQSACTAQKTEEEQQHHSSRPLSSARAPNCAQNETPSGTLHHSDSAQSAAEEEQCMHGGAGNCMQTAGEVYAFLSAGSAAHPDAASTDRHASGSGDSMAQPDLSRPESVAEPSRQSSRRSSALLGCKDQAPALCTPHRSISTNEPRLAPESASGWLRPQSGCGSMRSSTAGMACTPLSSEHASWQQSHCAQNANSCQGISGHNMGSTSGHANQHEPASSSGNDASKASNQATAQQEPGRYTSGSSSSSGGSQHRMQADNPSCSNSNHSSTASDQELVWPADPATCQTSALHADQVADASWNRIADAPLLACSQSFEATPNQHGSCSADMPAECQLLCHATDASAAAVMASHFSLSSQAQRALRRCTEPPQHADHSSTDKPDSDTCPSDTPRSKQSGVALTHSITCSRHAYRQ